MIPVIIINWNGISDTIECIDSILNSQWKDYRIHLIDNNSDNEEGEILKEHYSDNQLISLYQYNTNYGFTGAHNKIWNEDLRELDTEYIVLLNNDTVVSNSSIGIDSLTCRVNNNTLYALSMIQYNDRSLIDNLGLKLMTSGEILPIDFGKNRNVHSNSYTIGPSGGACVIPTSVIKKIGFYDDFFDTGYEDAEFALRATISGFKTVVLDDNMVYHKGGQSLKKVYQSKTVIKTQLNILYSIVKLLPPLSLFIAVVRIIIYYVGLIIISFIALRWNYALLFIKALFHFFRYDYSKAIISRRAFKPFRKLSSFEIMKIQESSLHLVWKRIWNYFILRRKSKVDQY